MNDAYLFLLVGFVMAALILAPALGDAWWARHKENRTATAEPLTMDTPADADERERVVVRAQ